MGTGRSGTQLLTSMLNQAGKSMVFHESNFMEDTATMEAFRESQSDARCYWEYFRKYEIYHRWKKSPRTNFYGEANGTIRYHAPAILSVFPDAKMVLVSRDGRGVVRSVMGWNQFYGSESTGAYALEPLPGDPYAIDWQQMSRFEKICWGWQEATEFLMAYIPADRWLQLEKIASDYDYFSKYLINYIGLEVSYDQWHQIVSRKSENATCRYDFPAWEDWSQSEQEAFIRIPEKQWLDLVISYDPFHR